MTVMRRLLAKPLAGLEIEALSLRALWTRHLVFALAIASVYPLPAHASDLTGVVTHVRDGDTIEVGTVPIRLNGLHAPELGTEAGERAAKFMQNLVLHKSVTCRLNGEKTYDRFAAVCWLNSDNMGLSKPRI